VATREASVRDSSSSQNPSEYRERHGDETNRDGGGQCERERATACSGVSFV
jgi:hypothetical protein